MTLSPNKNKNHKLGYRQRFPAETRNHNLRACLVSSKMMSQLWLQWTPLSFKRWLWMTGQSWPPCPMFNRVLYRQITPNDRYAESPFSRHQDTFRCSKDQLKNSVLDKLEFVISEIKGWGLGKKPSSNQCWFYQWSRASCTMSNQIILSWNNTFFSKNPDSKEFLRLCERHKVTRHTLRQMRHHRSTITILYCC